MPGLCRTCRWVTPTKSRWPCIEAWMPDKRVRDLDNLLKAPLDALTRAGFWVDDSQIADCASPERRCWAGCSR